jgi:hypothetical protein
VSTDGSGAGPLVALWHAADAEEVTKLRGMWHASLLRWGVQRRGDWPRTSGDEVAAHLADSSLVVHATWPEVHAALVTAGWDLSVVHLDGDGGVVEVSR